MAAPMFSTVSPVRYRGEAAGPVDAYGVDSWVPPAAGPAPRSARERCAQTGASPEPGSGTPDTRYPEAADCFPQPGGAAGVPLPSPAPAATKLRRYARPAAVAMIGVGLVAALTGWAMSDAAYLRGLSAGVIPVLGAWWVLSTAVTGHLREPH